jgi:hypothetical protein
MHTQSPLTCWWISEIPRTPKNEAAIKRHKSTFIPINDTKSVGRYWTPTISALFADLEKARTDLERCRLGLFARNQQKFSENHREWCVSCVVSCVLAATGPSLTRPLSLSLHQQVAGRCLHGRSGLPAFTRDHQFLAGRYGSFVPLLARTRMLRGVR